MKKMSKKKPAIKLNFNQISTLNDTGLEIFTNSFTYHDDDYFHKSLGTLFGVIQVSDHSKNSEYLPNLLTGIIKKSFYADSRKTAEESFEFALKKANLALADLAEHDIIEWTNNLHAIIGIFNKDTLYFTQVGAPLMLLGRKKEFISLSDSDQNTNTHPIKTFKDVIVGEIKVRDKIIIATPEINDIFKLTDLERLFHTFPPKEFDNIFFKTIKNEGENINALIINAAKEKRQPCPNQKVLNNEKVPLEKLTKNKNYLGETVKKNLSTTKTTTLRKKTHSNKETSGRIKKATSIADTKMPDALIANKKSPSIETLNDKKIPKKKKRLSPKKTTTKKELSKKTTKRKKGEKDNRASSLKNTKIKSIVDKQTKPLSTKTSSRKKISTRKLNDLTNKKVSLIKSEISPFEETPEIYIKNDEIKKRAKKPSTKKLKNFFNTSRKNKENTIKQKETPSEAINVPKKHKLALPTDKEMLAISHKYLSRIKSAFGIIISKTSQLSRKVISLIGSVLAKEKQIKLNSFVKKYKLHISILLFLILTPLLLKDLVGQKKKEVIPELKVPITKVPSQEKTSIEDKNKTRKILTLPSKITLLSGNDNLLIAYTQDNNLYTINKKTNDLTNLSLPSDIKLSDIKAINYIASLNLFFLASDTSVISYSPKTNKFYKNKISLPNEFKLGGQNTYLSYLYLLDKTSGQIYRYPRDTGGFGKRKKWLNTPLKNKNLVATISIDENIRIAYTDGTVEKYFGGKLQDTTKFTLKSLDFIMTGENLNAYYLLSKQNGQILKVNKKDNKIEKIYQNSDIQNSNTFSLNKEKNLLYIFNDKELLSIDL
jgi:hypothetical protein